MTAATSPFDLRGDVAVVTGGNRGIGRAIALGLARAGAAVAVLARDAQRNARVLEELRALGVPALAFAFDVTDREAHAPAFARIERTLGAIGILVNNAGSAGAGGGAPGLDRESWDATIDVHLNATFRLSKLAATSMVARRRGKIVNLASMYAIFGSGRFPAYSAAKGAVVQLTKSMAIELAPHVQVNAIAPGWIATDMTAPLRADAGFDRSIVARTPMRRWGEADDVAGAAVFLASRAADFVTGVVLTVDGGYSIA